MVRVEFYQPAGRFEVPGKGEFPERYAPHAFDRLIGQEAPFKIEGAERGRATVVAVKVDEDGAGATWTVDIEGELPSGSGRNMSFSVPEVPERWWE